MYTEIGPIQPVHRFCSGYMQAASSIHSKQIRQCPEIRAGVSHAKTIFKKRFHFYTTSHSENPQINYSLRLYYVHMTRRIARNMDLPQTERRVIVVLHGPALINRCQELFDAGWTLRAIGKVLDPPRSRSTISRWVHASRDSHKTTPGLPPPTDPFEGHPRRMRKTPPSPGISVTDRANIEALAPIARKYRSRLADNHPAAEANQALTNICRALYADGVRISELAEVANVSHTAMSKRVKGTS